MSKKVLLVLSLLVLTTLLSSCFKDNEYVKKVPVEAKETQQNEVKQNINEEVKEIEKVDQDENKVEGKGNYIKYSQEALKDAKGDIVLFFHADWCATCMATEKDIIEKGVPEDLTILNTNFDKELELRKKYGVTVQTTFVQVDNEGNLIKKWSGSKDLADIVEEVNK